MPERPKRRKNNKNKRKNKNNKPDPCKSNDQVNNFDNEATCTIQNNEGNSIAGAEQTNIVIDPTKNIQEENCESVKYNQSFTTTIDDTDASTGDFSNNNNNIMTISHNNSKAVNDSIVENILNVDIADSVTYLVEPPDYSPNTNKTNIKNIKSKSLDNEDATNIVEITDEATEIDNDISLGLVESQNALITHVESDIEWEVADELENEIQSQEAATGTLSITTIPLTTAQCDQYKSLTPEEEKSLRSYLKTINLVTQPEKLNTIEIKSEIEEIVNQEIKHRLRKKASADDFFLHRLGPPRILDVIDEEGSSESSLTSRRQSYLSDKKSDIDDLEDDVFEDKKKVIKHKEISSNYSTHKKGIGKIIPQECVLVGAKMKDSEVEARGEWTMKMVEKITGAEVVYLTDTSSSSSSLHEIGDDDDDGVDTDVSIRVITPTIEVTDTDNFFKKDFIPNISDSKINELFQDSSLTKIPIECYENNSQSHINKNEYVIKVEHEHDQKPEIKDDQHKNVIQMDNKIDSQEKCQTAYSENMKHIIDKVHKQESKESHEAINDIKNGERIITVEIQKDLKETNNLENMKNTSNHEIIVLSTDNIDTNLYVKDIDESKFTVEPLLPRNNLITKVLETDIKGEDVVDKNRKIHKISESIEEKEIKNLPIQSKLNIKDDHRLEIGQQIPNKQNLSSDFCKENSKTEVKNNKYVLETKVIKCEFNDAINNLINEVSTDLGCNNDYLKDTFIRQDSSSSVDSSQCTAKYNPNCESLNDISSIVHEDISSKKNSNIQETPLSVSHVKDIIECVAESSVESKDKINVNCTNQPLGLKDLCVHKIVSLPYGDKILEELASVSKRLQDFTTQVETCCTFSTSTNQDKNPLFYRSLDVASTDKTLRSNIVKEPIPPPVQPRHSSLKKSQEDDHWTASKKTDSAYVCLSPSQKMLMDKINNTKENSSHLVDSHKKVVHHREYEESYKSQQQINRNDINSSPYVPFKSQTGSRLLALIRDPNLTRNINSLNDRLSNSLAKSNPIIVSEKNRQDEPNKNLNVSFKPIPPPRPKKYSSSIYESDESDFTDNSMRSMKRDRKFFHHSTGTLNKEIESEVCSIQNMHRFLTATKEKLNDNIRPRRPSLPKDLCEQQMEYIRKKEKEVEAELQRLEVLKNNKCSSQWKGPKAPLISEKEVIDERIIDPSNYCITYKRDVAKKYEDQDSKKGKMSSLFNSSQEELLREKMYSEYVTQMAQREERKQHKVIKVTNCLESANKISKSMSALNAFDIDMKVNNRIEKEFISKARERWNKLGIKDPETEDELESAKYLYKEPKVIEHKIKVIEDGEEKDVKKLPSHLQEFVSFTARDTEQNAGSSGESASGPATPHLVIMCAVIIIVIAVGKYFLRMLRYN